MNEETFLGWVDHPVTQELRKILRNRVNDLKEQWAAGAFTDQSQFATAILNAKAIGNCELAEFVIGLDFEQFQEESKDA